MNFDLIKYFMNSYMFLSFGENDIKYHIPNVNLERTKHTVIFQGPKLWNNLNSDMKNKKSTATFKKTLKKDLLNFD